MKKLYLNTGGFDAIFNDLKDSFDGELSIDSNNEYKLIIKSKWARGTISGVCFDDRMIHMNFDLTLNHDVMLSIESFRSLPVFFLHCDNGNLIHSFGANGDKKSIKKDQTGILSNTSVINNVLYFESHKRIQFSLIGMPTKAYDDQSLEVITQLKRKFTRASGRYIYVGAESLKISKKWQELKTLPQQGIVRNLLQKIILNDIIELEIVQHSYSYLETFDPIINLANKQIIGIKRISNMSLSEVIYAAGLASRHYLPRIFKEKYHLSYKPFNQKLAS
ncbi:hypothetical protein [Flavobacterium hibernum]|uniref:HTH araC/xylS-type domain-containing protein n=1 Tax=Flavobacterium hibernum TaxID=37752 RepID=A0A0D0ET65_9FLAO|nr:hypothetical protein [Flavobacterium hibernum]KIO51688.1 hypothetical protein IW18_15550 [Flavobacterium hibernum]OXA91720.1 hypothetical protein B0A73_00320 [Flavobacterium hibernum]STO09791.1 Uncharacterised protein [Flavobacterium hibernum]